MESVLSKENIPGLTAAAENENYEYGKFIPILTEQEAGATHVDWYANDKEYEKVLNAVTK